MGSFTVYILYSHTLNKYYVGYTEDINTRLLQHNQGLSTYTAKANDWILVYKEVYLTRLDAMRREKEIKAKKSRIYIEWLVDSAG